MLSPENAEVLLDDLEDAVGRLDDGTPGPELADETGRLLESLDRLPGPSAPVERRAARLRAWTEVLLEELPPERRPGPGSPGDVVEGLLFELRDLVHEERTGLGS